MASTVYEDPPQVPGGEARPYLNDFLTTRLGVDQVALSARGIVLGRQSVARPLAVTGHYLNF